MYKGEEMLFDVAADESEQTDLRASFPATFTRLARRLRTILAAQPNYDSRTNMPPFSFNETDLAPIWAATARSGGVLTPRDWYEQKLPPPPPGKSPPPPAPRPPPLPETEIQGLTAPSDAAQRQGFQNPFALGLIAGAVVVLTLKCWRSRLGKQGRQRLVEQGEQGGT